MVCATITAYANAVVLGFLLKMYHRQPPRKVFVLLHAIALAMELVCLSATGWQIVASGEQASENQLSTSNLLFVILSASLTIIVFVFSLFALRHSWRLRSPAQVAADNASVEAVQKAGCPQELA